MRQKIACLADPVASRRRRDRRCRRGPAPRLGEDGGRKQGDQARRQGHQGGAGRDRAVPAAPRGHRRRRRHPRPLVRGARRAARRLRRRQAARDLPGLLPPVRVGLRRPHPEVPGRGRGRIRPRRRARRASGRCTSTIRRSRSGPTATGTRSWARASSARRAARCSCPSPGSRSCRACSRPGATTVVPPRRTWRSRRSCAGAADRTGRGRSGPPRPAAAGADRPPPRLINR